MGQGHARTNTSSELAFALQGEPDHYGSSNNGADDRGRLQHLSYSPENEDGHGDDPNVYNNYVQEQPHQDYTKGQMVHFPTVYEGYVYPPPVDSSVVSNGTDAEAYAAGAIELSHMCVPASEGVHFMGGYTQYS